MSLEDRSVILWIGVMLVTLSGLFFGVEIGIRLLGGGAFGGLIGGLLGLAAGFLIGVVGARWALGR